MAPHVLHHQRQEIGNASPYPALLFCESYEPMAKGTCFVATQENMWPNEAIFGFIVDYNCVIYPHLEYNKQSARALVQYLARFAK